MIESVRHIALMLPLGRGGLTFCLDTESNKEVKAWRLLRKMRFDCLMKSKLTPSALGFKHGFQRNTGLASFSFRKSLLGHSFALCAIEQNFNGCYWPSRPLDQTIGAAGGQHTRACTGHVRLIGDYAGLIFLCFVSFHLRKRNEGAARRLRAWRSDNIR